MFLLKNTKYKKYHKTHNMSAFTLIEALTVLFIFSLITTTFYSVFSLGGSYIIESKNRLGAVSLANEKMEIIRNLEYENVGVSGGIPSGDILATEIVNRASKEYEVKTSVIYKDDPFDGLGDDDPIEEDYKEAKVTVSWVGPKGAQSKFFLVARFAPVGVEQLSSGGLLSINVMDRYGVGVPQADVKIVNNNVSPAIDINTKTNDQGNLIYPGAPYSILGYELTVSKDGGYETIETISLDSVLYEATDIHASVIDGEMNVKSIVQDKVIDLKFIAKDRAENPVAGTAFDLLGGRILGYDRLFSPALPKYNVDDNYQTEANGEKFFEGISPGQFFVSGVDAPEGYTFIGMDDTVSFDPLKNNYVFSVIPGGEKTVNMKIADSSKNSVLIQAVNIADNSRLENATVTLSNNDGFSESVTTPSDGMAFFPLSDGTEMVIGTYHIKVEAENYQTYETDVEIISGLVEHQAGLTAD